MSKDKPQDRDRPAAGPAPSALPQGSLGAWLRTQREARGVSLREIADASKISVRYLEALERDRLDVLPAPVFTKGFLREYARVVGLDPDEAVNLYLLAADERPELPSDEASPRPPAYVGPSPLGYGLLLVLAVVILVGVAALVWWWVQGRAGGRGEPAGTPPAAPLATAGRPVDEAPAPFEARPTPAPGLVVPEPAAATAPGPLAPPSAPEPDRGGAPAAASGSPAAASEPPAAAPMRVVLEFSEDCWVEYVVDGGRRTSELRTSGEVVQLEAERSILLTLGNVTTVRVEVDGRPFPLSASGARVVRDLRIDREAIARLAGTAPALP